MLKSIHMTCFRKHESRKIVFTDGLSVLRGPNEAGKSSVTEAALYAFFGAKHLRDSFENVVTWGCKPSDLRVVVEFGDYEISRAKGGAEVRSMGQVLVTGQTEVTKFCENLLGCDAATAVTLMFANQNAIRGVLEAGPKAAATLLEGLSDFDLFDRLLDAAQHKLSLGSCAIQEERLSSLRAQIEALTLPEKPNEVEHQARVADLVMKEDLLRERITLDLEPRYADLDREYQAANLKFAERNQIDVEIARAQGRLKEAQAAIAAVAVAVPEIGVMDTTVIERQIADAAQWETLSAAYAKFNALHYEMGAVKRDASVAETARANLKQADETLSRLKQAYAVAEAKLVTSSVCGFCNQDVSQFPEVEKKNVALREEMARLEAEYDAIDSGKVGDVLLLEECAARLAEDGKLRAALRGIEQYVTVDDALLPLRAYWNGEVPVATGPDVAALKAELATVRAHNEAVIKATARLETLREQEVAHHTTLQYLHQHRDAIECVSENEFGTLCQQMSRLSSEMLEKVEAMNALRAEADALCVEHDEALRRYAEQAGVRDSLQTRINETEAEVEAITFNNQLLKKIRTARPVIGDRLWTMVLSAVSGIFSAMRGENSVVTRGEGGFLVNGKAATSLSGSTLDLLGIAIRIALVKTFLPNCPFLVLDEASAGMDNDRHGMMLAYIAASGFRQVIMVTHSDLPEALADNLVQL